MLGFFGNISRFVLLEIEGLVVDRNGRNTFHNNPMLRAVVMILQGKLRLWKNGDLLDLVSRVLFQDSICSPWPVGSCVHIGHLWSELFDFSHNVFDLLSGA